MWPFHGKFRDPLLYQRVFIDARLLQDGQQRSLWNISIVKRNDDPSSPFSVIVNTVTPRGMVQDESITLQNFNNFFRGP